MSLIALVHVALIVDGARVTFEPGETLPDLHAHDLEVLLESGAVEDSAAVARAEKANAAADKRAAKDFNDARDDIVSAREANAPVARAKKDSAAGASTEKADAAADKRAAKDFNDARDDTVSARGAIAPVARAKK